MASATLFILFFFIFDSTHATIFMPPQAGSNFNPTDKNNQMKRSVVIGSRPPRCEKTYCRNCGDCEAVQVPIVPKKFITPKHMMLASRGDDLSNYKPMCWKCKCGDFIFNP